MTKLAEASGIVIYEIENRLYISKRPASWTSTFLFVCGLFTFIILANGVLQLTLFKDQFQGSNKLGIILILIAILFSIIFWKVRAYRNKINATPLQALKNIAILDFEKNNLLDGQQNILTPLNKVYMMRKMQLTSSSPELKIHWDSGSISIVKGNPFSGSTVAIEKLLLTKGIRKNS